MNQLSYVKNHLEIPGMRMTLEKLVGLKAKTIECQYTDLTADDLNKYVKLWLDGKLHDNFESLTIDEGSPKKKIALNLDGLHTGYYERKYTDLNFAVESDFSLSKGLAGHVLLTCNRELFRFNVCNEDFM